MSDRSRQRLGEYAVDDGSITDVGRRQQVAVAVWVLGFLWGPFPALVALVVTRPRGGTYRQLVVGAALFWTAMIVLAGTLFALARDLSGWLLAGWALLSVVALVVTALAIRSALRSIGR